MGFGMPRGAAQYIAMTTEFGAHTRTACSCVATDLVASRRRHRGTRPSASVPLFRKPFHMFAIDAVAFAALP